MGAEDINIWNKKLLKLHVCDFICKPFVGSVILSEWTVIPPSVVVACIVCVVCVTGISGVKAVLVWNPFYCLRTLWWVVYKVVFPVITSVV